MDGQRQVLAHAARQEQALAAAVLRHERQPLATDERLARARDPHRLAPELDAAGRPPGAEKGLEELALPVPLQTADAEHLALEEVEADALQPRRAGEVADLQRDAAGRRRDPVGIEPVEPPPDHRRHDLVVGDGTRLVRRPRSRRCGRS